MISGLVHGGSDTPSGTGEFFVRASGEAILGTQRYFTKDFLVIFFAPPKGRL